MITVSPSFSAARPWSVEIIVASMFPETTAASRMPEPPDIGTIWASFLASRPTCASVKRMNASARPPAPLEAIFLPLSSLMSFILIRLARL